MTNTTDERTIHQRMAEVLAELPAIGKDQRNPQQGFMFRGHDDILNALNPLLAKHGVFIVPDAIKREIAQRQTARGSVLYEVNLLVRYRFYGLAGDWVEASAWGEGTDAGDKATNKAMTMAFKNVLNQAFAISSAEFSDADGQTPEQTTGRNGASRGDAKPAEPEPQRGRTENPRQLTREEAMAEFMERRVKLARIDKAWTREQILNDVTKRTGTVVKEYKDLPDEELGRLLRAARQASSGVEESLGIEQPTSEFVAPEGKRGAAV